MYCSSGPVALCRGGKVKQRALLLERCFCAGGPFSRNSAVGEGGVESPSFGKLVECLVDRSSGPEDLCGRGKVEHLGLPVEHGCWAEGPFSPNCSLGDLGSGNRGLTDGDCAGCGNGVYGGETWLDEADDEVPRGTRGISVAVCGNLVKLAEWLGRGRL